MKEIREILLEMEGFYFISKNNNCKFRNLNMIIVVIFNYGIMLDNILVKLEIIICIVR